MVDSKFQFYHILAGWSNSAHNSRIWNASQIAKEPEEYFSQEQYLLTDSAYGLTTYTMTPYKKPASLQLDNKKFNKELSHGRIDVENTYMV